MSFNPHVGLVEPPTPAHGTLAATELLLNLRSIFEDPAIERGMIDRDSSLAHHLFSLPVRNRVRDVPSYSPQDNGLLKLTALEVDHTAPPPSYRQGESIAELPLRKKLRQSPTPRQLGRDLSGES